MKELYISLAYKYDPEPIIGMLEENPIKKQRGCNLHEISFIKQFLDITLPVVSILNFPLKPNSVSNIHKDEILGRPEINPGFALNFPLYQTEETFMKWYTAMENYTKGLSYGGPSTGTATPKLLVDESTCIDTLHLNTPHLVNVKEWHSIENRYSDITSQIISIRFARNISYLNVIEYFAKKNPLPNDE